MSSLNALQQNIMNIFGAEKRQLDEDFMKFKKGEVGLTKILVKHYGRYDEAIATDDEPIACTAGCSYCCHYHVYVTPLEVFGITDWMRNNLPSKVQTEVHQRLADGLGQINGLNVDQHISTNIRCCFLADDGKCLVYPMRPLACRKHHAVEVTACKVTFDDPSSTMNSRKTAKRIAVSEGFVLAHWMLASTFNLDVTVYEMSGAVHEALSNPASLKRWKEAKVCFPTVKDRKHWEAAMNPAQPS